jgi:hypothetical protein
MSELTFICSVIKVFAKIIEWVSLTSLGLYILEVLGIGSWYFVCKVWILIIRE